jgi:hypothetical protein
MNGSGLLGELNNQLKMENKFVKKWQGLLFWERLIALIVGGPLLIICLELIVLLALALWVPALVYVIGEHYRSKAKKAENVKSELVNEHTI